MLCPPGKRISVLQDKLAELQIALRVKDETLTAQQAELAALSDTVQQLQDVERKVRHVSPGVV